MDISIIHPQAGSSVIYMEKERTCVFKIRLVNYFFSLAGSTAFFSRIRADLPVRSRR